MKTKILSVVLCGAIFLLGYPQTSSAFKTTDQTATKLSEEAAVYTISYAIGGFAETTYFPAFTERDNITATNTLTFEILEDQETPTTTGTAIGIVTSNDLVFENGMYKLPPRRMGRFTLTVLLITDQDTPEADYALKVKKLPFYRMDESQSNGLRSSGLTKGELSYYITDELELNDY